MLHPGLSTSNPARIILDKKLKDPSGALHSTFFDMMNGRLTVFRRFFSAFKYEPEFLFRADGSVYEGSYPCQTTNLLTLKKYLKIISRGRVIVFKFKLIMA